MRDTESVGTRLSVAASVVGCILFAACDAAMPGASGDVRDAFADAPVVEPVYLTVRDTLDNVDSPAVWHGAGGEHWLLVTAKEGDAIQVIEACTGALLERVGGSGSGVGQLDRPNGIAVMDDLMVVVERDNQRVQVFALPGFEPLGTFGETELRLPYGVALRGDGPGRYTAWITDSWEAAEDVLPPDRLLGDRVREYAFSVEGGTLASRHVRDFGATTGPGVLHVVESIAADVPRERLLIAEEEEGDSKIMVYTMDGMFTGQIIPATFFPHQAEGIALYACGPDDGYWIATDQGEEVNTFYVFGRVSLEPLGSFRGAGVLNTDGIALTQRSFAGFPGGAFFAVHDDGNVAAFRWRDIAERLNLRSDCESTDAH